MHACSGEGSALLLVVVVVKLTLRELNNDFKVLARARLSCGELMGGRLAANGGFRAAPTRLGRRGSVALGHRVPYYAHRSL